MTCIIAEIGGNHDGSLEKAKDLIYLAAKSGADYVKFQTYSAEKLVHPQATPLPQAPKGTKTQFERFKSLEFTNSEWIELINECYINDIKFLTTCFDHDSLDTYARHMDYIKIASGDLTYHDLIRHAVEFGKPILLSTGMASYEEIRESSSLIPRDLLIVMHCVSSYPTRPGDANLGVIRVLQDEYPRIGYSDHTQGLQAVKIAHILGCEVIEKHFTDEPRPYGDHSLSATPEALKQFTQWVTDTNEYMGLEKPCGAEMDNRRRMRRGMYASRDLEAGHILAFDDIDYLRPYTKHKSLGYKLKRDYKKGDAL